MTRSSKGIRRWAVVGALVVGVGTSVAAPHQRRPRLPTVGSIGGRCPKTAKITETAPMANVRAGQHCVLRPDGGRRCEQAARTVTSSTTWTRYDRTGPASRVPLRGGARLQVTVVAPAYDNYRQTYRPANRSELVNVAGWQTFRQIAWAGSLRGTVDHRTRRPGKVAVRVFVLQGPGAGSRFVIDVAHRW